MNEWLQKSNKFILVGPLTKEIEIKYEEYHRHLCHLTPRYFRTRATTT